MGNVGSMGSKMISKAAGIAGLISAFVFSVPGATWAQQGNATPEEVVQRVEEAAAYLARIFSDERAMRRSEVVLSHRRLL